MNTIALKILLVVTSHSQLGETGKPTGYYLPEVAHPYAVLAKKGYEIDIASPKGGLAPLDKKSLNDKDAVSKAFYENPTTRKKLENTLKLSDIDSSKYAAVLYAGGHGTMFDFRNNTAIEKINEQIYESGGIVAAVCHGPAALVSTKLRNGKYLVEGKNVAGFSNEEEEIAKLTEVMPFLLETELKKIGGKYTKAPAYKSHVVVDGRLITGQNPASAEAVGLAIAEGLSK